MSSGDPGLPGQLLPALAAFAAAYPAETWHGVHALSGGVHNLCWLLRSDHRQVVLRLAQVDAVRYGIDREHEARCHQQAATAGLAPPLLFADPAAGILVTAYLVAETVPRARQLELLGNALARLHRLPVVSVEADPLDNMETYLDHLRTGSSGHFAMAAAWAKRLRPVLLRYRQLADGQALCHCDPNPENVLMHAGGLVLIDWEYAAVTYPSYDLAVALELHEVSTSAESELVLSGYGVAPGAWHEQLALARPIYRFISLLWYALLAIDRPQCAKFAERMLQADLRRLQQLLPS